MSKTTARPSGHASDELTRLTACEAVDLLRKGEVTPGDLIDAAERRVGEVDPAVNALPARFFDRARSRAAELAPRHASAGSLAGLPVAIKDYTDVEGIATTYGSPIFRDSVATRSDYLVERLEANGALPFAKSNVPEIAGANTFNRVFGTTRNPWDTRMSVAGSSGGAAAAVATGMTWLAQGNDLGGSLRTPASFSSVVGLRPTPGRVARGPSPVCFDTLWVEGPMARNVPDVALMLDAMCGEHLGDPISLPRPPTSFSQAVAEPRPPRRVAFSPDLGGAFPVDPEVAEICAQAARRFADVGAEVEEASPDFTGAMETFQTLRAILFASWREPLLETHREQLPPEIAWNIEKGLALSAKEIARAERERVALYHRVAVFLGDYDLLCCPAASVPPFPVEQRYVEEIAGQPCKTYIDWIAITFAITLTTCPALSLPAGFTKSGLPVGLQIVGRPRGEADLLASARLLEETLGLAGKLPIDPVVRHVAES